MILKFDKSFEKDLLKLKNKELAAKVKQLILDIEKSDTLSDLNNVKKMEGFSSYYRIRIGDYRIGLELINESTVIFLRIKHRKDIYEFFP